MLRKKPSPADVFNEENLIANRRGTMTDVQTRRIRWPLWLTVCLQWIILAAVYAGSVYAVIYFEIHMPERILYGVVVVAAVVLILMGWITLRRLGSVSRREVASAAGAVTRRIRHADKGRLVHEVMIEKQRFVVAPEVYEAFEEGEFYRIYYQSGLKLLLTAEKV